MSLGYALLHPNRLEAAVRAKSRKQGFDAAADIFCGALGLDGLDVELEALFERQVEAIESFAARFETFIQPGQPLAVFRAFAEIDISTPDGLVEPVTKLLDFLESAESAQISVNVMPVVDALLDAAPSLDFEVVTSVVTARADEIIGLLKAPLRQGRKDLAAIRAYRAAMTIRCILDPVYQRLEAIGRIDLRALIRETIVSLLAGLDGISFEPLRAAIGNFRAEFGGLIEAVLKCSGSASFGIGVQTEPEPALNYLDELKAAPHTANNDPIRWIDFSTNVLSLFNLIWEFNRTRAIKRRPFDATVLVLGFIWQLVRTVVRGFWADKINLDKTDGSASAGARFGNWLFTDQGDLALQLFTRLLIPVFYENCAYTNWALMLLARGIQFVVNTFNVRLWYQFLRSMWYFDQFKEENQRRKTAEEKTLKKISFDRLIMGIWPMIWVAMGIVGGAFMPWDDFEIEEWGYEYAIFIVIPIVLWFVAHMWVGDATGLGYGEALSVGALPSWVTLAIMLTLLVFLLCTLIPVTQGLESEDRKAATIAAVVIPVVLIVALIGIAIVWGVRSQRNVVETSGVLSGFTTAVSLLFTLSVGALSAVFWWFTIDDGRDKHKAFDVLEDLDTPYRLPYRKDENWFCGQGFHGLFSHTTSSRGNLYSYDLNECPGQPALVSRAAIVTDVVQNNEDNGDDANSVRVLHSRWEPGIDPGNDEERVLTYCEYFHTQRNGVHARAGQIVPQGVHLVDIDSTGESAQHHLHIGVSTGQVTRPDEDSDDENAVDQEFENIPFVFGDGSVDFRQHPFFAWVPGKGSIKGKPISFAFYVSDNEEQRPHPAAASVPTERAAITIDGRDRQHVHRVVIDRSLLSGDEIPPSITVDTTVAEGHFHSVTLDAAALERVFHLQRPEVETTDAFGHRHPLGTPFRYETINYPTDEATVAVGGEDRAHTHNFSLDPTFLDRDALPPGGATFALTTFNFNDPAAGIAHSHSHTVTVDEGAIALGQSLQAPGTTTSTDDGHEHTLVATTAQSSRARALTVTVVQPPAAQLQAKRPAPYDLLGERLIVRVNDRATEWFLFGGERGRAAADVAVDGGLQPGQTILVGPTGLTIPPGTRLPALETARELTRQLRDTPSPADAPLRTVISRAEPVITIETRNRGINARVDRAGGTTLPNDLLPLGSAAVARGGGAFNNLGGVQRANLAGRITTLLQDGWNALTANAPVTEVTATLDPDGRVELALVAGGPFDFTGSAARILRVAVDLFDDPVFRATGPMPLTSGRLHLAPDYVVPILATPALVRFTPPAAGSDLDLVLSGARTTITLASADPVAVARQIMREVDGLRARDDSAEVVVETVAGGADVQLDVETGGTQLATDSGADPNRLDVGDTTALTPDRLQAIINDAQARRDPPYVSADVNPQAQVVGNGIEISVAAGHTIANPSVTFTGTTNPLPLVAAPGPNVIRFEPVPGLIAFEGPAWIDLEVDGSLMRIPIDGEPGRLDFALPRLPTNGERLALSVNGTAVNVDFDGSHQTLDAVADHIAGQSADIYVRIVYRLTVEQMVYGADPLGMNLPDADGLALAGFLGQRPIPSGAVGIGADMLALPGTLPGPIRRFGSLVEAFSLEREDAGGGLTQFCLEAEPGFDIAVATQPNRNPLGLARPAGVTTDVKSANLAATTDLGGFANRYNFTVTDAAGRTVAEAFGQLTAEPAIARAVRAPQIPWPDSQTLTIEVVGDGSAAVAVDLTDVTDIDEIAERIDQAVPQVRAWAAKIPVQFGATGFDFRLHIETLGGGTAWQLRLSPLQTALALGFPLEARDGDRLTFPGRGNVADAAAATLDEIESLLDETLRSTTGSFLPAALTGTRISVDTAPGQISLRSTEGEIEVVTEPPSLRDRLVVTQAPDVTTLAPGPTLTLDSGLILLRAGGRGLAAVEIFGDPAELRGDDPVPVAPPAPGPGDPFTDTLNLLKANPLEIRINGFNHVLPVVPATAATLDDAVEFLANQRDDFWIGLVEDPLGSGSRFCVIQTRRRGAAAGLSLSFQNFGGGGTPFPANGILGFLPGQLANSDPANPGLWTVGAVGVGNLLDLDNAPLNSVFLIPGLEFLVRQAVGRGGARQAIYTASAETPAPGAPTTLQLRGNLSTVQLSQTNVTSQPGNVQLAPPGGAVGNAGTVLEDLYNGERGLQSGFMEIQSNDGGDPRRVRSLFHAEAARLTDLELPTTIDVLVGRALRLQIGGDIDQHVIAAAAAGAPLTAGALARQLERAFAWCIRVRVLAGPDRLEIETLTRGRSAVLVLLAAQGEPDAVTGDAATGLTAPESLPIAVQGSGSVADLSLVDAATYAQVLQEGMIGDRTDADDAQRARAVINGSAYDPPELDLTDTPAETFLAIRPLSREFARLISRRTGCASSVIPLQLRNGLAIPTVFEMERSLERAPAVRAAIRIPPFDRQTLTGALHIQLNENGGAVGLPPERTIVVDVPSAEYSPVDLARLIHARLFDGGAGAAQVYLDGSIMVETSALGLAGSVRIPGVSTPASGADRDLVDTLLPGGDFVRGWPGAARTGPGGALFPGFRSRDGTATGATWTFTDGDDRIVTFNVPDGADLGTIATDLNAALANGVESTGAVPPQRIGLAAFGADGALYIEGLDAGFTMDPVPETQDPERLGQAPEREEEPAVGLRRTHEARTTRIIRDRNGRNVATEFDDLGWTRLPAHIETGDPRPILDMPPGRYLTAVRADAAKTHEYDAASEMIALAATDPDDPNRHFVLRARYWVTWGGSALFRISKNADEEFLVDLERQIR